MNNADNTKEFIDIRVTAMAISIDKSHVIDTAISVAGRTVSVSLAVKLIRCKSTSTHNAADGSSVVSMERDSVGNIVIKSESSKGMLEGSTDELEVYHNSAENPGSSRQIPEVRSNIMLAPPSTNIIINKRKARDNISPKNMDKIITRSKKEDGNLIKVNKLKEITSDHSISLQK